MAGSPELIHIMTGITGEFNKVAILARYESLACELYFQKYMQDNEEAKQMKDCQELYIKGSKEFNKVW